MDGRRYLVLVEKQDDGTYSAYVPDLPGCVAVGQETPGAAKRLIREAIEFHIEGLKARGNPVPEPTTQGEYIDAPAA